MKYESPNYDRNLFGILADLNSSDCDLVIHALLDVVYSDADAQVIKKIYFQFSQHSDYWIAKNAINGVGDLFRVRTEEIKDEAEEAIEQLLSIAKARRELEPVVRDAVEDIEIFCGLDSSRGDIASNE